MPPLAAGGLTISGGTTAQTLATTAAKMTGWLAASSYDSRSDDGDTSVRPDVTNNRMLVLAPGRYKVALDLEGTSDGAMDLTAQIYKNGVAVSDLKSKSYISTTNNYSLAFGGILKVDATDNPKTIKTFDDTTATTSPPAQVTYSAAPKVMVPVEVYLTASTGTPAFTPVNAHLTIERID